MVDASLSCKHQRLRNILDKIDYQKKEAQRKQEQVDYMRTQIETLEKELDNHTSQITALEEERTMLCESISEVEVSDKCNTYGRRANALRPACFFPHWEGTATKPYGQTPQPQRMERGHGQPHTGGATTTHRNDGQRGSQEGGLRTLRLLGTRPQSRAGGHARRRRCCAAVRAHTVRVGSRGRPL